MSTNTPLSEAETVAAAAPDSEFQLPNATTDNNEDFNDDGNSIFNLYNIISELATIGRQEDLEKLRTISEDYYEILAPAFHDVCDSTIGIKTPLGPVNSRSFIRIYSNQAREGKMITNANWTSEMADMFKKLCVFGTEHPETSFPNEISTTALITELNPYVTHLKLTCLYGLLDTEACNTQLPAFVNQFKNLKQVEMKYQLYGLPPNHEIPVPQLKTGLQNIIPKVQIQLILEGAESRFQEIVEGLGSTMKNLSIILKFPNVFRNSFWLNEIDFPLTWDFFGNLTNVIYDLPMYRMRAERMVIFRQFTQICVQNQHRIKSLGLYLTLDYFNEDAEAMRTQLMLLSKILTKLLVSNQTGRQDKLDLFINNPGISCNWPKLEILDIRGYDRPLEILKNCPKLKALSLVYEDLSSCIYHNDAQSPKESLKEYFGNKPNLKSLTIFGRPNYHLQQMLGNKIEFEAQLKEVLPKGVKIYLEPFDFKAEEEKFVTEEEANE